MELLDCIVSEKNEIRKRLDGMATIGGDDSWLFLPKNPEGRICLVAHIDTVHEEGSFDFWGSKRVNKKRRVTLPKKDMFYDSAKRVYWSPDGLGADDRAGVWACLKLFNELPEPFKPIILLTDGEETGGIGAYEAANFIDGHYEALKTVSYFIELDRKGSNDCVFYNYEPKEFVDYIQEFGFEKDSGSFTDISIVGPAAGLCGVNLSTGYYSQHTKQETLRLDELENNVERVREILQTHDKKQWVLPAYGYDTDFDYIGQCCTCREILWEGSIDISGGLCRCGYCGTPIEGVMPVEIDNTNEGWSIHT